MTWGQNFYTRCAKNESIAMKNLAALRAAIFPLSANAAEMANLQQIIKQPTRTNSNTDNLRDLIFTNSQTIIDSGTLSPFAHLDHFPIQVTVDLEIPVVKAEPKYIHGHLGLLKHETLPSSLRLYSAQTGTVY